MKLLKWHDRLVHWCPGCRGTHQITSAWSFDDNMEQPTFNPSVRVTYNGIDADQERKDEDDTEVGRAPSRCCHYFLHGGELKYCEDSTHHLAGKSVALLEIPEGVVEMYRNC